MDLLVWLFSLASLFLIVRTLIAIRRIRAARNGDELEPALQLAVLKENLLAQPSESQLDRLVGFCNRHSIDVDIESYKPLLDRHKGIRRHDNVLAADSLLFEEQAKWLDEVEPLEFQDAREAHNAGDFEQFCRYTLEGMLRLYSDDKILETLGVLENTAHCHEDFPLSAESISELTVGYQELCQLRDNSPADPESLDKLNQARDKWFEAVREAIP